MRRRYVRLAAAAFFAFAVPAAAPRQAAATDPLGDLTGPWQLFVDDYGVATKTNVTRVYHAFEKYAANPVLVADKVWEGSYVYLYGSVLPNENGLGYRMWYHSIPGDGDKYRLLYATSADGIQWEKPNLGIVTYNGSTNNNIFIRRTGTDHIPSVIHTPWETDPQRAYKLINFDNAYGFVGACASDAIHWTDTGPKPLVGSGDVGNFVWDPLESRYLGYVKVGAYVNGLKRRAVGFSTTSVFESWPSPYLIMAPDTFDDGWATGIQRTHFYGFCGFAYESMYLGFLWVFRATDAEGYYDGTIFIELASSHDGVHWTREEGDRPAILPLGPAGSWDDGMLFTTQQPLVEGDTIKLYYGGFDITHASPTPGYGSIGFATLRKDGFASLDAAGSTGSVMTKKLVGASGPLHVNFRAPSGWLKVEVTDENGDALPGYSQADCNILQGDSVDQPVTWTAQSELPGSPARIRLRFILENASLYSFMGGEALEVMEEPTITQQPQPRNICPGGSAEFTVNAISADPILYQWQKDGVDLGDGGHCWGATTARLLITGADSGDAGSYRCVLTNVAGSTVSNAAALTFIATSLTGVGFVPGGTNSTVAGITADGSVVCGSSAGRAFIWTDDDGIRSLGTPSGATTSSAAGVGLHNGNVVVAVNSDASTYKAKRWTGNTAGVGTFADLPRMDGNQEWLARALGTNGTSDLWIAGSSLNGGDGNGREAGRYQQSSNNTLSYTLPPSGHDHSDFHAASDNGFFAGQFQYLGTFPTGGARNGMKSLGTACVSLYSLYGPPSTAYEAVAKAISRDSLVQGGWSAGPSSGTTPVIWRDPATVTTIPFLPGEAFGETKALNGDGSIAGGYSRTATSSTRHAWIWDAVNGTRDVAALLQSHDVDLTGWQLNETLGMSGSMAGELTGLVLTGAGTHDSVSEGWVAVLGYRPTPPPTIVQQPPLQDVCPGDTAAFTAAATGEGTILYQWRRNGMYIGDDSRVSGTATATLTISGVDAGDAGDYSCLVANSCGSVTSAAASLTLKTATVITEQPANQSVPLGGEANFLVAADGAGSLAYQWQKNAVDLSDGGHYSGTTTPMLTVAGVDAGDVGDYRCVVTGECGTAVSGDATLTLSTVPADFDTDADVDLGDFGLFQACFNGPNQPAKGACAVAATDLDGDEDVDLADFAIFQSCFNGANRAPKCFP